MEKIDNKGINSLRLKYLSILLFSLLSWFFVGGIILSIFSKVSKTKVAIFSSIFIPHIVLLISFLAVFFLLFKESPLPLLYDKKPSIKREAGVALLTLFLLSIFSLFSIKTLVFNSEDSTLTKILFLVISLPLFFVQTLSEELIFRFLLFKIISPLSWPKDRKREIIISLISGLFFLLPHLSNREVIEGKRVIYAILTYFLWGFLLMYLALRTHSFISSWVIHYVNNLFSSSFISSTSSTLSSAPLFYDVNKSYSPLLVISTISIFIVIFLFEVRRR